MIAKVGYITPEIFGMLLHKRTQALPHPENSNANLNPQSPRKQKIISTRL
jgi:hypothetical protein